MEGTKPKKGLREALRFVLFALVSASAGLIETGVFYLLGLIPGLNYWACYLPALVASVVWNFTLNRRITFRSAVNVPAAMLKVFLYYLVFTPLSTWLGNWLVEVRFPHLAWMEHVVYFGTLLVNFVTEYLYQRFYVFRNNIDNRDAAPAASEREADHAL